MQTATRTRYPSMPHRVDLTELVEVAGWELVLDPDRYRLVFNLDHDGRAVTTPIDRIDTLPLTGAMKIVHANGAAETHLHASATTRVEVI